MTAAPPRIGGRWRRRQPAGATASGPAEGAGPLLECRALTKAFGEVQAVDHVDLAVGRGERLGIIGPNGSGKTTLFNCLSGFVPVTAGQVWWRGNDVTGWPCQRRARHGLVRTFQQVAIFADLTVRESVVRANLCRDALGRKEPRLAGLAGDDPDHLIELCNLTGYAERRVVELAYGTQKLVNVAMALATNPTLLMLDEPAAGLSAEEATELGTVIRAAADEGMTFCLVDHNMPFLSSLCNRVVCLNAGAVLREGTPQEIRDDDEVRQVYLGSR